MLLQLLRGLVGRKAHRRGVDLPGDVHSAMSEHSLVVVGADFAGQGPGFVILDGRVKSRFGHASNGGNLQDHSCDIDPESVSTP